jgi:hypothetical protein
MRCCAVRVVLSLSLSLSLVMGAGLVVASDAAAVDFSDRDLLIETLSLDEQAPLEAAQADQAEAAEALAAAEGALAEAEAANPPDPEAIADAEAEVAARQADYDASVAAVEAIEAEIAQTAELVGELSAKQVHDLNAALQSARQTDLLPLDIDAAQLQAILDGGYGTREIHALAQAYESKARFERLALRFLERFDATGRPHFADQAERFDAKGAAQSEKFLAKLDRFAAQDAAQAAREAAREAAAEARTDNGRHLAKGRQP